MNLLLLSALSPAVDAEAVARRVEAALAPIRSLSGESVRRYEDDRKGRATGFFAFEGERRRSDQSLPDAPNEVSSTYSDDREATDLRSKEGRVVGANLHLARRRASRGVYDDLAVAGDRPLAQAVRDGTLRKVTEGCLLRLEIPGGARYEATLDSRRSYLPARTLLRHADGSVTETRLEDWRKIGGVPLPHLARRTAKWSDGDRSAFTDRYVRFRVNEPLGELLTPPTEFPPGTKIHDNAADAFYEVAPDGTWRKTGV